MLRNVKIQKIFGGLKKNVILLHIRYRRFSGRCTHLSPYYYLSLQEVNYVY